MADDVWWTVMAWTVTVVILGQVDRAQVSPSYQVKINSFVKAYIKNLGLLEPWLVITRTIWTTQEDAAFINDRTGTVVNVRW